MGIERLIALLEENGSSGVDLAPHAYLVLMGDEAVRKGMVMAEQIRGQLPSLRLTSHCGGGSFKSQFKKADKSGARFALVVGEDELKREVVAVKPLREEGEQQELSLTRLVEFFKEQVI